MAMTRSQAWDLLTKYNKEPFHLRHAITVEHVMGWYARELGYGDRAEFWSTVGLLHDLDFEMWPEEHCVKSQELMRQAGVEEEMIRAAASHGWGNCVDIKPEHEMEKVLYACDELTGLIGAAALMRPSKSTADMELKSLKKKFKDKKFAAGCSRDVIANGAELLGWELDKLLDMTLKAMQAEEEAIEGEVAALG
jgi:predicted hydrolase (HD superfamily)